MKGADSVFGMGHEGEDASRSVADACNVVGRSVRVVVVSKEDLPVVLHLVEDVTGSVVPAFAVRDRNTECRLFGGFVVGVLEAEVLPSADEASRCVFCERSGEEVGFGKNLESVADPYDQRSFRCLPFERREDGLEGGERARSEVVSPGEAAGQQDGLRLAGDGGRGAVDEGRGVAGDLSDGGEEIVLAVRAREADDSAGGGGKHGGSVARWI